jgi:hypothetical protein
MKRGGISESDVDIGFRVESSEFRKTIAAMQRIAGGT